IPSAIRSNYTRSSRSVRRFRHSRRASSSLRPLLDLLAQEIAYLVALRAAAECAHTFAHQARKRAHPFLSHLLFVSLDDLDDGLAYFVVASAPETLPFCGLGGRQSRIFGDRCEQVGDPLARHFILPIEVEQGEESVVVNVFDRNAIAAEFGCSALDRARRERRIHAPFDGRLE